MMPPRDWQAVEQEAGPRPIPNGAASREHARGLLRHASVLDVQQMSDMLDAQFRLREAAQAGRTQAVRALVVVAEALCARQWDDAKRAGNEPENWPSEQISAFIVQHARSDLQRAALAARPDLASDYERLATELADARADRGRLVAELERAQADARRLATELVRATRGKQGRAQDAEPMAGEDGIGCVQAGDEPHDAKQLNAVPAERVDALISLIASSGLSRSDEVREKLAAEWGVERGSSRVGLAVRAALHRGLLEARPCVVEWPGEKTRHFLVLTMAGLARADELGVTMAPSEYELGLKHHKTADHLYLVLKAADVLRAEGYGEVNFAPECIEVGNGQYCPDIAALEAGKPAFIECERSKDKLREAKWERAAKANGGIIRLITPNRKVMDAITSEIKATTGSRHKIWAFNISEYAAGARGANNSLWLHQR
jgi:hypothetical protein